MEYINRPEVETQTGEREGTPLHPDDLADFNRNQEDIFDEIIADINEKLEDANYYYKKTAKILSEIL